MFKKHSIAERDGSDLRAFLLAGGDGTRLQSLTRKIDGDQRPKQFSKIFGGKSLLTHTRDRLRPIFADDRVASGIVRSNADDLARLPPDRIFRVSGCFRGWGGASGYIERLFGGH